MKIKKNKRIIKIAFGIYMLILISVLVFKLPTDMVKNTLLELLEGRKIYRSPMQLVPFKTIIEYAQNVHSFTDWFIKNLVCNVVMFLPLGFFVPVMIEDKWKNAVGKGMYSFVFTAVSGFMLSVGIEIFQYITCLGLCDIDDVILNVDGCIFGYSIYYIIIEVKAISWY